MLIKSKSFTLWTEELNVLTKQYPKRLIRNKNYGKKKLM